MNLHQAILEHNPAAVFSIVDGQITSYEGGSLPTPQELEQAWQRIQDRQNAAVALKAAREQMAAKFDGLTTTERAAFYGVRVAAEGALDKGDAAAARLVVEQAQVPPELESIKAEILALFPSL